MDKETAYMVGVTLVTWVMAWKMVFGGIAALELWGMGFLTSSCILAGMMADMKPTKRLTRAQALRYRGKGHA